MKRSERIYKQSREHFWFAILSLVVCVASASWASTAFLSDGGSPGGLLVVAAVGALIIALMAFVAFVGMIMEAIHLNYLGAQEESEEWKKSIRPKL